MTNQVLITGGAGFIGSNLAFRLLSEGRRVSIVDDLSRPGVERNLERLAEEFGSQLTFERQDIGQASLKRLVRDVQEVYHFAAQVAVTASLESPELDFDTNVRGTLRLLEALRSQLSPAKLLFTSTNKVYGALDDIALLRNEQHYRPADPDFQSGIPESRGLDFYTPYGCSKGAADQYVLDYARSYRLPTAVFRMSCIYGPRQCGTEDQGWVAHFLLRVMANEPVTIYGDGFQVRDVLYIEDLLDAFRLAMANLPRLAGQAFNIGGGTSRAVSLMDVLDVMAESTGNRPQLNFAPWRPGDQRYYVSDTRKFEHATGWKPKFSVREGLGQLHAWLARNHGQTHAVLTTQS